MEEALDLSFDRLLMMMMMMMMMMIRQLDCRYFKILMVSVFTLLRRKNRKKLADKNCTFGSGSVLLCGNKEEAFELDG